MNKLNLLFLGLSTIIISCGPSAEEIAAAEKAKMDSVVSATEINMIKEQARKDSIAAANVMAAAEEEANKAQLIELKGQLAGEEAKLEDIKKFKIGRPAAEKEYQIAEQTKVIEGLKMQIGELEK